MDQSAITVRYAKAIFETAKEKSLLDEMKADMEWLAELSGQSKEFALLLESPIVNTSKKAALINSVFGGKVNKLSLNFLLLLVENKREEYLPGICRNFLDLTRKDQNIKSAVLTTATVISREILAKVEQLLSKELNATVELTSKTKPEILGGLVLRLDDKQYDASVATKLKNIKQNLLETEL